MGRIVVLSLGRHIVRRISSAGRTGAFIIAVAAAATVGAVGSRAAPRSPAAVPAKLVGTWTRKVTASDVARAHSTGIPPGTVWTLTVKPNGAAVVGSPGIVTFGGKVIPAGVGRARLELGLASPDVYRWSGTTRRLTFDKIRDPVADRVAVFSGAWRRR